MSDQQTTATDSTYEAPGAQLRQARERAGVSLQEVSERTKIALHRLEGLERDDYKSVGGRAYVVGYARAHARAIGVAPQPFVEGFEAALRREDIQAQEKEAVEAAPVRGGHSLHKNLIPIAAGVVALILLLGWFLLDDSQTANVEGVAQQSPVTEVEPRGNPAQSQPAEDSLVAAPGAQQPIPAPVEPDRFVAAEDSAPETAATGRQNANAELTPNDAPVSSTVVVEPSADAVPEAVTGESSTAQAAAEVSAQLDSLQLSFTDECWVAVTDATGKSLVARVAHSGDNLQLFGQAPFDVTLGNARAAQVQLNGELVPVEPRPGRRVLRLRVGD